MGLFIAFGLSFWLAMVGFSLTVYRQETKQPVRGSEPQLIYKYLALWEFFCYKLNLRAKKIQKESETAAEIEEAEIIPEESNVFEWNEVYYSRNEKEEIISFEIVAKEEN